MSRDNNTKFGHSGYAVEIAKKNELISLVRKVAKHYGESEENFKEYVAEVLTKDRGLALDCFRDLEKQCEYIPIKQKKNRQGGDK